jgi:hypothetical protein
VTASALGDPQLVGVRNSRELSGFLVTVALHRQTLATLTKTLLPLLLLTLIMYASLHFPKQMASSKASIAITGALSAAVLLASINSQLGGNIGYTLAVEYAFYVFFGLSFLCILSVLCAERLHATDRGDLATRTERWTRIVFLMAVSVVVAGAIGLAWSQ